jgi:HTH-type transcriptional regulator / antitoxin HigA
MPKNVVPLVDHPGSFIVDELEARGWAQADLAFILGVLPQHLNKLLTGKMDISPDMATSLADAFNMPAEFFANLQKMYDLQRAKKPDAGVKTRAAWLSVFPIREMINRGWIEETDSDLIDLQMMRFFGKNRIEDIPFVGTGEIVAHVAKKTSYGATTPIQYAWLHRVMKIAEGMEAPLYSDKILRDSLRSIRAHLMDKDDLIHIPEILRKCGVRFVLVEALHGSKIDGVCVWIRGQPAIGLTTRLDRLDNFAFVLRHEIEHVLRGDGRDASFSPVDEFDGNYAGSEGLPPEEMLANSAASEFCVPRQDLNSFIARKSPFISERDVLNFAARLEIHPAIVIGQIQNRTKKYAWLRKYQTGVREYLLDWKFTDGWGLQAPTGL